MAEVINFEKTEDKKNKVQKYDFKKENLHEVLCISEQELDTIVKKAMTDFGSMYEQENSTGYTNVYEAFKIFIDETRDFKERFALFAAIMMQLNEAVEMKNAFNLIFALTSKPIVDRSLISVFNEVKGMKIALQQAIAEANQSPIIKP